MAFIDPNRPEITPAEQQLPLQSPASFFEDRPRMDGWTANRPRSSGLMLAGGLVTALIIAGWITLSSGKFETGNAINTLPTTVGQPTTALIVSPVMPATAGQAPAH